MITIDEKIKLFEKIVYEKVEKENEGMMEEFLADYGSLIDSKKEEYNREAERILQESKRKTEREKTTLLSKAKIESNKWIRNTQKAIFAEIVNGLLEYGKKYCQTSEYEVKFMEDFNQMISQVESGEFELYCVESDLQRFKDTIMEKSKGKKVHFHIDNDLIGGFVLSDPALGIKYDMSIQGKVLASRETIGNILVKNIQ